MRELRGLLLTRIVRCDVVYKVSIGMRRKEKG